jgi:hypothetical protein
MWEAEIRKIIVTSQSRKKSVRLYFNGNKLDMVVHTCHPSNNRKHKIGRPHSRTAWVQARTYH